MKTSRITIGLIIIFLLNIQLLTGCFSSGESLPYYTLSQEFTEYCWFETNSYWIYQNDSTLATDSVKITEVEEAKRFNPQGVDYNYQAVDMYMKTNVFGFSRHELTAGDYEAAANEMNSLLRLYEADGSYRLVFSPKYAIGEEIDLGAGVGLYSNVEIIGSLEINGNTYSDVYHTKIIMESGTGTEYNYWIAKNFSLVKSVVINNGQTISISLKSANLIAH